MCTTVEIETTSKNVIVTSPYQPDFPKLARTIGGRWKNPSWIFDIRDESRVRELCRHIYGTDGTTGEMVTLKVTVPTDEYDRSLSLYVAGRQVARAFDRDSGARLGEGIVLIKGSFYSGGSRKNPVIGVEAETVFEIRDVPRAAAGNIPDWCTAEIVDETIDKEALETELKKIEERAAEIRRILGQ
jgi:hypothetical protein